MRIIREKEDYDNLLEMLEIRRKPAIVSAFYEAWGSSFRRRPDLLESRDYGGQAVGSLSAEAMAEPGRRRWKHHPDALVRSGQLGVGSRISLFHSRKE